jgi:hypothetical protein
MKHFDKLLKILGNLSRLKNIFLLIILTRLLFLEPSQLALIAEIISGIAMLMATSVEGVDVDE